MGEAVQNEQLNHLPESKMKPRSKISIVWLVPLVAIIIGLWLGYKAWSEMGSEIMITFLTAEGLEAGKTKIKYKDVEIGKVKKIQVSRDSKEVVVTAEMIKDAEHFLTENSRFWVVRARISASGATGLGTLLSGAYISIDPGLKGKSAYQFSGLEIPPVITGNIPGRRFVLQTKYLGSIDKDVPVYYRKFKVGRVEDVAIDEDGQSVTINVFISAPYDQWINTSTNFWNASGIDFSLNASGVNVNTESLVSILIGGIAFDSSELSTQDNELENNAKFELYKSQADSLKVDHSKGNKFVIHFSESVRGLTVGAPVEFRGIQVGEVSDIQLLFDEVNQIINIPVTLSFNTSRIAFKGGERAQDEFSDNRHYQLEKLIKRGLRAQLETGNLLTGQMYIALDFFPETAPFVIDWNSDIPELPSIPGTIGRVKNNISSILQKVDAMMTQAEELSYKLNQNMEPELSATLQQVNAMMLQIKELSYKLNHKLEPELTGTIKQAESTLVTIQDTLKSDSVLQQDLHIALREFTKAARSIRSLADYVEKHPESLLKGKKGR
ncbi:MAG: MCE family protein [gamma proteobacterium symbiont of Taylorina sp.]|nr:MCE family protein [gamma proteobacterium symbiont of Taylorina sp.]